MIVEVCLLWCHQKKNYHKLPGEEKTFFFLDTSGFLDWLSTSLIKTWQWVECVTLKKKLYFLPLQPRLLCTQRAPMQRCLSLELSELSVEILDFVILIRFTAGPADVEHLLPSQRPQLARCSKHSNRHKTKRKSTTNFMWRFPPGCQLSLCVLDPLHSRQWTFISLIVHRALLSL